MATIEKRITFTPTSTAGALLREVSKLTGQSPAKIVRELMDEAAPALKVTVDALRVVKRRPEEAQAAVARMAAKAHADLAQATLELDTAIRKKPGRKPKRGKPTEASRVRKGNRGRGAANTG